MVKAGLARAQQGLTAPVALTARSTFRVAATFQVMELRAMERVHLGQIRSVQDESEFVGFCFLRGSFTRT